MVRGAWIGQGAYSMAGPSGLIVRQQRRLFLAVGIDNFSAQLTPREHMPIILLIILFTALMGCGTDQRDKSIGLDSKPGFHIRFIPKSDGTTRVTIPTLMPHEINSSNQHYHRGFKYGYYRHGNNRQLVIKVSGELYRLGSGYKAMQIFDNKTDAAQFRAGEEAGQQLAEKRMDVIEEIMFRIAAPNRPLLPEADP